MINPLKALLFLAGGTATAGVGAYVSGALDPYLMSPPAAVANLPADAAQPTVSVTPAEEAAPKEDRIDAAATAGQQPAAEQPSSAATEAEQKPAEAAPSEDKPAGQDVAALDPAAPAAEPAKPAAEPPAAVTPGPVLPTFDLVRVEPDGSVVVAGKAPANATVELLAGDVVIGSGKASEAGDFAIVLEKRLEPGDYQIAIRATNADASVVMSAQTAIVSIPKQPDGPVLAMIEEPGKPSEIITAPQPAAAEPKPAEQAAGPVPGEKPAEAAAAPAQDQPAAAADPAKPAVDVAVEAVEIEGNRIFVAGRAPAGTTVRVYADEVRLGDNKASPAGRFLVEAERELSVGSHMVRADVLGPDGVEVIARAAVPFEREAGENVAAVAAKLAEVAPAQPEPAPAAAAEPPTAPAAPAAEQPAAPAQAAATEAGGEPAESAPATPAPAAAAATGGETEPAAVAAATPPADDVTAPPLQNVKSAVIIRRGDSLWRISKRVYGRGVRYSTIYLANQDQIRDPDRIWPGQVFTVPGKTEEGETADMTRVGEQATSKAE